MTVLRAVIFDLDDTLYPERAYVVSGFRAAAAWAEASFGIPKEQGFGELTRLLETGVRGDTFDRWLDGHGLNSNQRCARMVQVYREHDPSIVPYPEVPGLLRRLRRRYRLGLVSDGYGDVQRRKLGALQIGSFFDAVVFSDDWGRHAWKPSVCPFEIVLQKLGMAGPQAAYVGDNPEKDFIGARQLGLRTIRIRRPDGLCREREPVSPDHAADFEIDGLHRLETIVAEIR